MTRDTLLEPTPPASASAGSASAPTVPTKLCLIIVFNHRYEGNLPKLERIYGQRFHHIRYLMPFYRGDRPDVYPVYYSSFQFEGFFRTVWERLREEGFTHFLFCADDMILNPRLDETNFCSRLGIDADSGYIKDVRAITDCGPWWSAFMSALIDVAGKGGVNWASELPDYAAAGKNLAAKGYPMGRFGWHTLRRGFRAKAFFQIFFYLALRFNEWRKDRRTDPLAPPYPLLFGNADLLVVPAASMEKFCAYSSVFATMGVFVEVGAPTALYLSCPKVRREEETGLLGYDWMFKPHEREAFARPYDYNLDRLLGEYDEKWLCLHSIKLSEWRFSS